MNYTKIYASIVLRAQAERTERLALKKQGKYFESHHIIPKSFGGKDDKSNRSLLTAREHFICHWLLVKMYPICSKERGQMLNAIWRMRNISPHHNAHRYVNNHVYEVLRIEFANRQKSIVNQRGNRNSRYGTKWYTSMYTGESKTFIDSPDGKEWVPGRNVFNGRTTSIKQRLKHYQMLSKKRVREENKTNRIAKGFNSFQIELHSNAVEYAHAMWDKFHSGNYSKLEDFANELGISKMALSKRFSKYIPIYSCHNQKKLKHCRSNKDMIGKYE